MFMVKCMYFLNMNVYIYTGFDVFELKTHLDGNLKKLSRETNLKSPLT